MKTITQRVLETVLRLGTCSIEQGIAAVGKYVSASLASAYWRKDRRYNTKRNKGGGKRTDQRGIRIIVTNALYHLTHQGRIRRVDRGVYAAPLPKLFESA